MAWAFQRIFRPVRSARLATSMVSVNLEAKPSKRQKAGAPPRQAASHSWWWLWPVARGWEDRGGLKSRNRSRGSRTQSPPVHSTDESVPFVPTTIAPLAASLEPPTSSADGFCPPSYQYSVISPRPPLAGNSSLSREEAGKVSGLSPDVWRISAEAGGPSWSAANGMAALWMPISPTAPVPKSFHPRQVKGQ